jgi:hypothetical protein
MANPYSKDIENSKILYDILREDLEKHRVLHIDVVLPERRRD